MTIAVIVGGICFCLLSTQSSHNSRSLYYLFNVDVLAITNSKGGALVIHSPVIMKEKEQFDEPEFDVNEYSKMDGLFIENTWNAEFASESKPEEDDIILLNRKNFSAFEGTGLKDILDYNYIRRVFLMGFLSNGCIEETARAMREQCPDIDIYMLTDGSAAKSQVDHTNAITVTLPLYGNCITCQEAESLLSMKQLRKYKRDSLIGVLPQSIFRPRILALCGAQSNDEVTKLQLENLQITEENHDITYLRGQIEVEEGSPDLIGLGKFILLTCFQMERKKHNF